MTKVAAQAARFVVIAMCPSSGTTAVVLPQLNPNQQNHKINTPSAPSGMLCPGIACGLPSLY